jgi:CheY-like chemotaxis protein
MLTSEAVAQDLPRLRRYARALTGSQVAGDSYVSATLEALTQDPSPIADDITTGLFRTFSQIWRSVGLNRQAESISAEGADRHLSRIAPLPRQAFLLLSLEDFPEDQAARILDVDVDELREMVDQFGRDLANEIACRVLIIEDEPLIALSLEDIVTGLGHEVVGVARTHREAVEMARSQTPGLVLADINLADRSSGLEAVNELLEESELPVIFITAYPERLLTGKRPEPTFLIPKPFRSTHVAAVISQALFFDRKAHGARGRKQEDETLTDAR